MLGEKYFISIMLAGLAALLLACGSDSGGGTSSGGAGAGGGGADGGGGRGPYLPDKGPINTFYTGAINGGGDFVATTEGKLNADEKPTYFEQIVLSDGRFWYALAYNTDQFKGVATGKGKLSGNDFTDSNVSSFWSGRKNQAFKASGTLKIDFSSPDTMYDGTLTLNSVDLELVPDGIFFGNEYKILSASPADQAGTWSAVDGRGGAAVAVTIASSGTIQGTQNTSAGTCTFEGTLTPETDNYFFTVTLTMAQQNCPSSQLGRIYSGAGFFYHDVDEDEDVFLIITTNDDSRFWKYLKGKKQ